MNAISAATNAIAGTWHHYFGGGKKGPEATREVLIAKEGFIAPPQRGVRDSKRLPYGRQAQELVATGVLQREVDRRERDIHYYNQNKSGVFPRYEGYK